MLLTFCHTKPKHPHGPSWIFLSIPLSFSLSLSPDQSGCSHRVDTTLRHLPVKSQLFLITYTKCALKGECCLSKLMHIGTWLGIFALLYCGNIAVTITNFLFWCYSFYCICSTKDWLKT